MPNSKSAELTPYGVRIRELRERRKMTQAEFAELAGVTARAQRNYEAGLRTPNISYLEALAIADIDIGYILTGLESQMLEKADADAFAFLSEHLGLPFTFQVSFSSNISAFRHGHIDREQLNNLIADDLTKYRISVLDADRLSSILEAIHRLAPDLPVRKKAGIACLLYRAFRSSEHLDPKAVKEAVDLAS